jgi:hypothetical protein
VRIDQELILSRPESDAIDELETLIRAQYPSALFQVEPDPEGSDALWLTTTVDLEDTEQVLELVIDKVMEIQLDRGLPIHVLPLRPIERVLAELQSTQQAEKAAAKPGVGA